MDAIIDAIIDFMWSYNNTIKWTCETSVLTMLFLKTTRFWKKITKPIPPRLLRWLHRNDSTAMTLPRRFFRTQFSRDLFVVILNSQFSWIRGTLPAHIPFGKTRTLTNQYPTDTQQTLDQHPIDTEQQTRDRPLTDTQTVPLRVWLKIPLRVLSRAVLRVTTRISVGDQRGKSSGDFRQKTFLSRSFSFFLVILPAFLFGWFPFGKSCKNMTHDVVSDVMPRKTRTRETENRDFANWPKRQTQALTNNKSKGR